MAEEHSTDLVEYRLVPGFSRYCVGSDGSVWSSYSRSWRRLRVSVDHHGYPRVGLCKRGAGGRTTTVHSIILAAFVGPRPLGCECRHLNGIPNDNRLANLCWGTHAENQMDSVRHGTASPGKSHPASKLTEAAVREIRKQYGAGNSLSYLAQAFGVSPRTITKVILREAWKHIVAPPYSCRSEQRECRNL